MNAKATPHTLLRLIGRSEVAVDTLEVRFAKPHGMKFKAGQFMDLTLIDPPETDAKGNTRGFSITSAPDDPDLTFTTRLRDSAFKRVLRSLPTGTEVQVEGPFGNFTLHNNASLRAVLLAGGIGITPFRSMIRWADHAKLPHRIVLFYSNRRPETAPFLDEMRKLASTNPNFTFVPTMTQTMTQMSGSSATWSGETGRLDREMIKRHLKRVAPTADPLAGAIYYIAGPAHMVSAIHAMLNEAGVNDDDIRTEEFSGY